MSMGQEGRKRDTLTERQATALRFIVERLDRTGQAPTLMEIGAELGAGLSAAYTQVTALQRKGYVRRLPDMARGLVVLKAPPAE